MPLKVNIGIRFDEPVQTQFYVYLKSLTALVLCLLVKSLILL